MKKKIKESTFKGLIKDLRLDTGNGLDIVGFTSNRGPFELSFYGEMEDNYRLSIEHFGMNVNGNWEEIEPTESQIETMQNEILSKVEEIQEGNIVQFQENYGIYNEYY